VVVFKSYDRDINTRPSRDYEDGPILWCDA